MTNQWQGIYLDGHTPIRVSVVVSFNSNGIEIRDHQSLKMLWPFDQIHLTYKNDPKEPFRIKRNKTGPEALLVSNPLFLKALHQFSPAQTAHLFRSGQRSLKLKMAVFALLGTLVLVPGFYFFILPLATVAASKFVPVAWEEQYGNSILKGFGAPEDFCNDPRSMTVLDSILKDLSKAIPDNPYTFHLKIVNNNVINAFAVPGGNIIVNRGLLEATESPDEFAGVLAHEIQHIVGRHSTREILREASTSLLVASLTGQFVNNRTIGLQGVSMLETLRYNRTLEEEADRGGMKIMVNARYQPEAMIRMFEKFKKNEGEQGNLITFMSTHPSTQNRIEELEQLMHQLNSQPVPHPELKSWKETRQICQNPT